MIVQGNRGWEEQKHIKDITEGVANGTQYGGNAIGSKLSG